MLRVSKVVVKCLCMGRTCWVQLVKPDLRLTKWVSLFFVFEVSLQEEMKSPWARTKNSQIYAVCQWAREKEVERVSDSKKWSDLRGYSRLPEQSRRSSQYLAASGTTELQGKLREHSSDVSGMPSADRTTAASAAGFLVGLFS
jgi:hypothetical protein